MPITNTEIPGFFCSDPDVQRFCEIEARDMSPYKRQLSARQLFEAARARFGDYRCWDLEFWEQ